MINSHSRACRRFEQHITCGCDNCFQVVKKPEHMANEEAAALLYTGLTVWNALKMAGGLSVLNAVGKNVLVIGGSGGVGNCAIQLLKSWGAKVLYITP